MKPFYNTPTPHAGTRPELKPLTGKELLYALEDQYSEYRKAIELGYCKSDPAIHAKFKADIAAATSALPTS